MAGPGAGQTGRLQARRGECHRARPGGGWEIIVRVFGIHWVFEHRSDEINLAEGDMGKISEAEKLGWETSV